MDVLRIEKVGMDDTLTSKKITLKLGFICLFSVLRNGQGIIW